MDAKVRIGASEDFLDGTSVDTPAGAGLFREGVTVSDPSNPIARAAVTNNAPAVDAYAMAVRVIGGVVVGSEVEIKNDSGNPIPVAGGISVINFPATQLVVDTKQSGNWGYVSGTSGTVTLPAGSRVLQISAASVSAGTFSVNGGDEILIPANQQFTLEPRGNLISPTVSFNNTASYVIEFVS